MTDSFVRRVKKGDEILDADQQIWTATHDAEVPELDTVNCHVWVKRVAPDGTRWSRKLSHKNSTGWSLVEEEEEDDCAIVRLVK